MIFKYIEIVENNWKYDGISGYFYPIDSTVTPKLLKRLHQFVSKMQFFYIPLNDNDNKIEEVQLFDQKTVDSLIETNEYIGYTRFSVKDYTLTGPVLDKFLKYVEEWDMAEEISYEWVFDNISFAVHDSVN